MLLWAVLSQGSPAACLSGGGVFFWSDEMFWNETEVMAVQHCESTKLYSFIELIYII